MAAPDVPDPLLTLKQAAARLSVHPTTLRRWADQGSIAVIITPGGHRRFPQSAVEAMATHAGPPRRRPATWAEQALTHTRADLAAHRDAQWLAKLDDREREEKRLMGQRVMGLMMQYLAAGAGEEDAILAEAHTLGQAYAEGAREAGLDLTDALHATMFFRDHIVESAVMLPEAARAHPEGNRRLLRRINTFLNTIQLAVAEAYRAAS